jgi:hypothetical protein
LPSRTNGLTTSNAITTIQLPTSAFFAGYNPKQFVTPGAAVPYNPIYGLPGYSYVNGGSFGTTYSSATFAALPGFEAYQSGRTFRLGMRIMF